MTDGFEIDARDLKDLGLKLRRASLDVRREVDKTLLVIGKEIEEAAKLKAAEHSRTIAQTVKMRAIPGAVVISAGAEDVPIAALYEMGNKGSKRSAKTFKHPVFGRDVWVDQPKFPYLAPALAVDRANITRRMEATWDRVLASSGLAG